MKAVKKAVSIGAVSALLLAGLAAAWYAGRQGSSERVMPAAAPEVLSTETAGSAAIEAYRPGEVPYEETRQFTGPPPPKKVRGNVKGG